MLLKRSEQIDIGYCPACLLYKSVYTINVVRTIEYVTACFILFDISTMELSVQYCDKRIYVLVKGKHVS